MKVVPVLPGAGEHQVKGMIASSERKDATTTKRGQLLSPQIATFEIPFRLPASRQISSQLVYPGGPK